LAAPALPAPQLSESFDNAVVVVISNPAQR